jgi:hypothetical protein
MPRISGGVTEHAYAADDVQAPDLLPPLPTFALGGLPNSNSPPHDFDELVRARLCQLAGDRAVLIAADEGASSLIIDASEMGRTSVRRVRIDELEQGMYLLLRTAGGGDFIVPLADRILGASAAKLRSEQVEWKDRLMRSAIERFGALSRRDLSSLVCTELHSQGLSHVRPAHVHYWMSSKCIRPRQSEDFAAVIKWAGLEDRAQSLWTAMGEIDRAHRRAGHLIRRMLLQKIAETSLDPLERDGEFDFELGEQGGGSISAYQITDIAAEELDVPLDRINLLLDMEE